MEFSTPSQAAELKGWFTNPEAAIDAKITAVKEIFNVSGGSKATQDAIQDFTFKAFETLDKMNLDTTKKEVLRAFGDNLMGRKA
jgi:geranylgeranyl diphosphate synthase type II